MSEHNEEKLDAWLREQLRGALPKPPLEEVDWAGLRQRIALQAQPALFRLRRNNRTRAAWWDYAARWALPALPAALAAAAALTLLLGRLERPSAAEPSAALAAAQRLTVEAAIGAAPRDEETRELFAPADRDALLRAAVTGR